MDKTYSKIVNCVSDGDVLLQVSRVVGTSEKRATIIFDGDDDEVYVLSFDKRQLEDFIVQLQEVKAII